MGPVMIVDAGRIDSSENVVRTFLEHNVRTSAELDRGQGFDAEFFRMLIQSIIVPALVAVGAEMAKDSAKAAYHAGRAKLLELFSSEVDVEKVPSASDVAEIHGHFIGLGLSEAQTRQMLAALSEHLKRQSVR